jgi:FKBP-type peptidyl-prolyl cis-trans isomerase FkpA
MKALRFLILAAALAACSPNDSTAPVQTETSVETQVWASSLGINLAQMTKLPSGVYIQDLTVGTGTTLSGLGGVRVIYTGWLANGTRFDGNENGSSPYSNTLTNLIPGWQLGMQGMKVGGKRRLVIPSALAYGTQGNGPIPGNSNLVFDVSLTGVY